VNRADRRQELVEELRAASPEPRSAAWLARRFEVSVRTIERDLEALRAAGLPVSSTPARPGGYALAREPAASPLMLTLTEAIEQGRVLHLIYEDRSGALTERDVEPFGLLWGRHGWSLLAWCRLRRAARGFLLDRMRAVQVRPGLVAGRSEAELRRELARWNTPVSRDT